MTCVLPSYWRSIRVGAEVSDGAGDARRSRSLSGAAAGLNQSLHTLARSCRRAARLREIEHVGMENLGSRPEGLTGLLQGLCRAGVAGAGGDGEDEKPVQRRACWIKRITATRTPITTTAARALSRPMNRAKRAPA